MRRGRPGRPPPAARCPRPGARCAPRSPTSRPTPHTRPAQHGGFMLASVVRPTDAGLTDMFQWMAVRPAERARCTSWF
ncbi:hypothetical protein C6T71_07125 [Burkholderia multivorans]|nr:hypothetical protein C6T71_07125 [Burkholderia multivorans]